MIKLSSAHYTILHILADGLCHSGTELGKKLGITRSAIWKQVNQLIDYELPIMSIPNQGYKLKHELILLDEQEIRNELHTHNWHNPIHLHLFPSIDSTNRYLKELPISSPLALCCAELQTQGRGRFGRSWHSPFGENIYCSSRWSLQGDLTKLSGLSLVTSLAVVATLKEFNENVPIKIKWPNDILWKDKKLCGSLIEIIAESNANAQIIIGIGLNVNSDTQRNPLPDKAWCSLYEITQKRHDRNKLIARLIVNLERYLTRFIHLDLHAFMDEWHQYDYLLDKNITVHQAFESISGVACGINGSGQLILENQEGRHLLSSGDTSLKNS
jgi:BirA family transcriptional regulator, biotin operon repressor / biotin---[acetyl-CoA-carboxylase] ligase